MRKIQRFSTSVSLVLLATLATPYLLQAEEDVMVLGRGEKAFNLGKKSTAQKEEAPAAEAPATSSSLRVLGVWLVLGGVIAGAVTLYYRRRTSQILTGGKNHNMTLIERLSLGHQREILLLKACDRLLVVACQGGQVTLLSDMPAEESPAQPFPNLTAPQAEPQGFQVPAPAAPAAPVHSQAQSFAHLLAGRAETNVIPGAWAAGNTALTAAAATASASPKPRQQMQRPTNETISSAYAWPEIEGNGK